MFSHKWFSIFILFLTLVGTCCFKEIINKVGLVYQICELVIYSGSLSKYCLYSSYSIQHSHRCASVSFLLIFNFLYFFFHFIPSNFVFNTLIITLLQFLGLWHSVVCFCCGLLHSFGFRDVVYVVVVSSCSCMCCSASEFPLFLFYSHILVSCVLEFNSTCHVSLSWDYYQPVSFSLITCCVYLSFSAAIQPF